MFFFCSTHTHPLSNCSPYLGYICWHVFVSFFFLYFIYCRFQGLVITKFLACLMLAQLFSLLFSFWRTSSMYFVVPYQPNGLVSHLYDYFFFFYFFFGFRRNDNMQSFFIHHLLVLFILSLYNLIFFRLWYSFLTFHLF